MIKKLECIEKATEGTPERLIIWLHGLGADATDFLPIVEFFGLSSTLFVFPNAPVIPITINQGALMRAWYDVKQLDFSDRIDKNQLENSVLQIESIIEEYIQKGIAPKNIIVGGFSQGGVVSLEVGFRNYHNIAAAVGLSCYFNLSGDERKSNKQTKFFLGHGKMDELIPFSYGKQAKNSLEQEGFAVQWKEYLIGHSVSEEELTDVKEFIMEL